MIAARLSFPKAPEPPVQRTPLPDAYRTVVEIARRARTRVVIVGRWA